MSNQFASYINPALEEILLEAVRQRQIAINGFTERQVVDLLCQICKSGDIHILVAQDPDRQSAVYVPFREVERLRTENEELKRELAEWEELIKKPREPDRMLTDDPS